MSDERRSNMYDSLRLAAGGGLSTTLEKVEQAKDTVTLAIGIGGTGLSALRTLKKTVYERVKQDNFEKRDTESPKYDKIKFLLIDSDETKAHSSLTSADFPEEEFQYVGVSNIIAELELIRKDTKKTYLNWLNRNITIEEAREGAGGVRQVGKYLLSKQASQLKSKIQTLIRDAIIGMDANNSINIYIMTGIGGGTGSGCFIDVCYLVRQALEDLGRKGSASVLGFFFLPDVNLADENFPKSPVYQNLIKSNGYAALKELDYLMGIPENGDVYEQQYSETFRIRQETTPVDLCHLISSTDINGKIIENGYDYAMNVVSEYILNYVVDANAVGNEKKEESGITIKGLIPNLAALVRKVYKSHGANYKYQILGTSCAVVPYKQIGTYLASRYLGAIEYIRDYRPQKKDVENFCRNVRFTFRDLEREVLDKTSRLHLDAKRFATQKLKEARIGTINPVLAEVCEGWRATLAGIRTRNIKTLERRLERYDVTDMPETVLGRIFRELIRITADPKLGPYFAAYMLKDGQNHTIDSELKGIRAEAESLRNAAIGQTQYRKEQLDAAQTAFKSARLDFGDKKKEKYVEMVQAWYQNQENIDTYDAIVTMLDHIERELDELRVQYFAKYVRILDKLFMTFEDNKKHFGEGIENLYTWSIVDINSVKEQLDEIIDAKIQRNEMNEFVAPEFVENMNTLMINNASSWIDENEEKINAMFSDHILDQFRDAMSKTMNQFLQEKFKVIGKGLVGNIAKSVIKEGLVDRGTPMFHINSVQHDLSDDQKCVPYYVLSLPNNEDDIVAAAQKCKKNYTLEMAIAQTVLTDRIFMLEFFAGIPMYAYADLEGYEKVYQKNLDPGIHLNEYKEKDWRKLPSPFPASYESLNYVHAESVQEAKQIFEEAKEYSVIKENEEIRTATIYASADENVHSRKVPSAKDTLAEIKEALDAAKSARAHYEDTLVEAAELRATNGDYEDTIRDDFVRKPVFVEKVRDELSKVKAMDEEIAALEKAFSEREKLGDKQAEFIRALLHSVIRRERGNYKFSYEKRGVEETILLKSDADVKYEAIPVYRAFQAYQQLDEEVLEKIQEATKAATDDVTDEIYENAIAFKDFYMGNYRDYKKSASSGSFIDGEEINTFLEELADSIESFIINNK